jgi:hypothetical protein
MAFVPAPYCAQVQVLGDIAGRTAQYTIDANFGGVYELSDLGDLAAAVDGWWNTDMQGLVGSNVTYLGVTVKGLASAEDLEFTLSEPLPGMAESTALPANVAVVLTKRTGFTGRSARGRCYFWGVPSESMLDERHFTETWVGYYQDAGDALLAAIVGAGWSPVVISYVTGGVPRVSGVSKIITQVQIRDNRYDTQRRRLGKS